MRRTFNATERAALYLSAGGQCQGCGDALPSGWHADHVQPYARGGATDVVNGQALCPPCNLKKGTRLVTTPTATSTWTRPLRDWQYECYNEYRLHAGKDFLCVATPGAGKTLFALYVAAQAREAGVVQRIVVVTPTDHLRTQWVAVAKSVGLDLTGDFAPGSGGEAADYQGIVTTYQAVAQNPAIYRAQTQRPTFVVLDEPHHLNGHRSWGQAARRAFEHAVKRLSITGTPFRSDNATIPFVEYDDEGRCVAHYTYDYARAIADEACRPIYFPAYEGELRWWTSTHGEVSATFQDPLPRDQDSRRLNTAIDPAGEWLAKVLRAADERLTFCRDTFLPSAGGLVIARDQQHARAVARVLAGITGERPIVAVSEDTNASAQIEAFADGTQRWLVAVRMVSEGVDIPRLTVGVYATNILTELYFRQAVGRFVRCYPGSDGQTAWLHIPPVDQLIEYVQRIKQMRDVGVAVDTEAEERETGIDPLDPPRPGAVFTPLESRATDFNIWDHDGGSFHERELAEARALAAQLGVPLSDALVAKLIRLVRATDATAPASPPPTVPALSGRGEPLDRVKAQKRRVLANLVNRVAATDGIDQKAVHAWLITRTGVQVQHRTVAQLDECIALLTTRLTEAQEVRPWWTD